MNEALIEEKVACTHCGETCDDESIRHEENVFCCYGCKAVHELLQNSGLKSHYETTSEQNKSFGGLKAERKFAFLDNADIQRELLKFQDETRSVIRLSLPGIHCSSCIYLLEHLPKLNVAILRSEVNFVRKEISVTFQHEMLSLKELVILLSQLGYTPDISLSSVDKTKKHVTKSGLGLKIAVAGFCFGNTMLLSMPEYLDTQFQLTQDFKELFGWMSIIFSVPVLLYSAQDYFIKAFKGIRVANLNIDVPIALGILTLFVRSVYEIWTATGMGYFDSLTGLVFFLLIGKWYQSKSYQALSFDRDYASYFPVSVACLVDGGEVQKPLRELVKGDRVVLHNDELIPADGVVVNGAANLDYSFVTGESALVEKGEGQRVFAGGRQKGGELVVELTSEVSSSELTGLWNSDAFQKEPSDLHTWVDKVSSYFTLSIILLALLSGVYWWNTDQSLVWNSITAVLIVACPCALALVLPFAYGHSMRLLGKRGLYLKNAEVVEKMASVGHVVFDKTGTLTSNDSSVQFIGSELLNEEKAILKSALGNSAHPLSRLIHDAMPAMQKVPISGFSEFTGKGFEAVLNDIIIKVGSAEFLGIEENANAGESRVHVFVNSYRGYFTIKSSYRKGVFEMLKELKSNYFLSLLSGDSDGERTRLGDYFDTLKFKQKPADKLEYLSSQQSATLMIGDGLNDAGALKKADVGIAVAEDIHQFSPACDSIISSEKVTILPRILSFSKRIKSIVFVAFGLSFLYNIVGLSFAMSGHLTPLISAILMPISSVTVVGFVTLMTSLSSRKTLS